MRACRPAVVRPPWRPRPGRRPPSWARRRQPWLLLVAYAAARPQWKHGTAAAGPQNPAPAGHQIRPAERRPADLALAHAGQDAIAEKPVKLAA